MIFLLFCSLFLPTGDTSKQFSLPQGSGPGGRRLVTLYQCEGEQITLACARGTINIVRANFGRFSIAVCNQHGQTNWTTDCASPHTATTITKMCEKLQTCVVSVNPDTLGDACPHTPKYLEVHYFCQEEEENTVPARHSPRFQDTELTALWNQNSHKVNIDSVLRAMKDRESVSSTQRVPITTDFFSSEELGPSPKIRPTLSDFNDTDSTQKPQSTINQSSEKGNLVQSGPSPLREKPSPLSESREVDEEEREAGLDWMEEDAGLSSPESEETVSSMFVLEVITYAVASICGIILIFLIFKFLFQLRGGSVRSGCPCLRRKESESGYSDTSSGSGLNSSPLERCKIPNSPAAAAAAASNQQQAARGSVNHCMELEPGHRFSGIRYSVASLENMSEVSLSGSNLPRHIGQYDDRANMNVSPYPQVSSPNPSRVMQGSPQNGLTFPSDAYLDKGQIGNSLYGNGQHLATSPYLSAVSGHCGSCRQEARRPRTQDYHPDSQLDPYMYRGPTLSPAPRPHSKMGSDV